MCCVCDAIRVLHERKPVMFSWDDSATKLEFEGKGKKPEFAKAKYRFRRAGDAEWNGWYETVDLAGVMSRLGTDVFTAEALRREVSDWLGGAAVQPVLDSIAEHEVFITKVLTERENCEAKEEN
jgi:hypothetical protein